MDLSSALLPYLFAFKCTHCSPRKLLLGSSSLELASLVASLFHPPTSAPLLFLLYNFICGPFTRWLLPKPLARNAPSGFSSSRTPTLCSSDPRITCLGCPSLPCPIHTILSIKFPSMQFLLKHNAKGGLG